MFHKETLKGELETTFIPIIPILIYLSASKIQPGEGRVWALHITPFIAIGLVGRG
jgi:hypothetical protein